MAVFSFGFPVFMFLGGFAAMGFFFSLAVLGWVAATLTALTVVRVPQLSLCCLGALIRLTPTERCLVGRGGGHR